MKRPSPLLLLFLLGSVLLACQKQDAHLINTGLRAEYADHPCCANLSLLDNATITEFDESRQDFLLYAVNIDAYVASEGLNPGDIVQLDVQVLNRPLNENVEINCNSICNRHNGILVNIIRLKKE